MEARNGSDSSSDSSIGNVDKGTKLKQKLDEFTNKLDQGGNRRKMGKQNAEHPANPNKDLSDGERLIKYLSENPKLFRFSKIAPSHRTGDRCKLHGNFIVIKPKFSSAQSTIQVGSSEKIPQEEAICRFCNDTFKGKNAVMLACKCNKNTLAHESCSDQNNKNCDGCEQELQKLLVTLHLEPYSPRSTNDKNNKGSSLSRLLGCASLGKRKVDDS